MEFTTNETKVSRTGLENFISCAWVCLASPRSLENFGIVLRYQKRRLVRRRTDEVWHQEIMTCATELKDAKTLGYQDDCRGSLYGRTSVFCLPGD